jgi:hypothetical protein
MATIMKFCQLPSPITGNQESAPISIYSESIKVSQVPNVIFILLLGESGRFFDLGLLIEESQARRLASERK